MATEVVIPMLGVTVENGKVVEWLKREGDIVEKGESIFVVEADKVTTEVESPASGILAKILLPPGEEVPVLSVIGIITTEGENVPEKYLQWNQSGFAPQTATDDSVASIAHTTRSTDAADYDLAVIGGGPGGYVAAICGARNGLKTVLIEKDALGGTCLNRGCIPTKSLINDTMLFSSVKNASFLSGIKSVQLGVSEMFERKRSVVKTLVSGVNRLVKSNDVELFKGEGTLEAAGLISVKNSMGDHRTISAQNVILANGSRPGVPPFIKVDGKFIQTTDDILDDSVFPESILIIGGGVIGIEMATIFSNAGTKVTIIEMFEDILLTEDKDIRKQMAMQLKKRKVQLMLSCAVKKVTIDIPKVRVDYQVNGKAVMESLTVDKVLVATGRTPDFTGLDVNKLGIECEGPFIKVDPNLRTSLPGVYAIGDLVGGMMLAHKASAEAEVAVENILGSSKSIDSHLIPRCIWGALEVGAVGLTEEEASKTGRNIKIGKFPFGASGAAQAKGHISGLAKIIGDVNTGEILGVHIIGEHATDMIAEAVTVMKMEGAVEDLYEAIKPHPTLSEIVFEAALDWNSRAIHLPRDKRK